MSHFGIYMNNPTEGKVDGTKISSDGSGTLPLTVTLDASKNEEKIMKCAVRCDEGYEVKDEIKISFSGTSADKWKVANDDDYASSEEAAQFCNWQTELTVSSVTTVNKCFWTKAMSVEGELPSNDSSVKIKAEGIVSKEEER